MTQTYKSKREESIGRALLCLSVPLFVLSDSPFLLHKHTKHTLSLFPRRAGRSASDLPPPFYLQQCPTTAFPPTLSFPSTALAAGNGDPAPLDQTPLRFQPGLSVLSLQCLYLARRHPFFSVPFIHHNLGINALCLPACFLPRPMAWVSVTELRTMLYNVLLSRRSSDLLSTMAFNPLSPGECARRCWPSLPSSPGQAASPLARRSSV